MRSVFSTKSPLKVAIVGVVVVGLLGFGAIQLVPVKRTNPPVIKEPNWDSPETRALAARACFDCHSNETKWPWYAYVAPVSWLVSKDTIKGRDELNFSEWTPQRRPDRITGEIRSGKMPERKYLIMHPEAKLTDAEKQALIDGLTRTIAQSQ